MPQTSAISIGAILPRKIEARKDETSEIREVFEYSMGCFVLNRSIWGPVKRCDIIQVSEGWMTVQFIRKEQCTLPYPATLGTSHSMKPRALVGIRGI